MPFNYIKLLTKFSFPLHDRLVEPKKHLIKSAKSFSTTLKTLLSKIAATTNLNAIKTTNGHG